MAYKPQRTSWSYQIYCDLCISMKLRLAGLLKEKRRHTFRRIAQERNVPTYVVKSIYWRAIAPQLRAGTDIRDLK